MTNAIDAEIQKIDTEIETLAIIRARLLNVRDNAASAPVAAVKKTRKTRQQRGMPAGEAKPLAGLGL